MTAKECKSWMQRTETESCINFMSKWLVPQNGLNEGTVYEGRPVGNSPEFMPLDMSLNNDIKRSHDYHCALSYNLPFDHPAKLSTSKPVWISKGIKR